MKVLNILLNKIKNDNSQLFLLFSLIIFMLLFATGFVSDDFSEISNIKEKKNDFQYLPFNTYLNIPILYYTHYIFYYFISIDNYILISLIKFFYTILSFYMVSKFFSIFTNYYNSFLISFLFIFWPTHDSTVYFFLAQYLMLTVAFQLYAYYLLTKNFFKTSIIFSLLGSFISYGSTPIALGLFALFIFNNSLKKSLYIIIPNIIYVIYYIFISKIFLISSISRIPNSFDFLSLIKNYILQIVTLLDVNIGISFLIKLFNSILENNLFTLTISIATSILLIFIKKRNSLNFNKFQFDSKLSIAFILIIFISLFMFATTGGYYQVIFNLGNRVSIYSSLLFSYLFVYIIQNKKINFFAILFAMIIIFGISNHWKNIQFNQNNIIKNISLNQKLKNYSNNNILFITGNEYSNFGKFSHIEFFSASHVAESIFSINNLDHINVKTLNKSFTFDGKYLKDDKFANRKFLVNNEIMVYDSNTDTITLINNNKIVDYIKNLEQKNRHWIQLLDNQFINEMVFKYLPNLKYLF